MLGVPNTLQRDGCLGDYDRLLGEYEIESGATKGDSFKQKSRPDNLEFVSTLDSSQKVERMFLEVKAPNSMVKCWW